MNKIGELNAKAATFVIYYDREDTNPYKVYWKYYENGYHRKLVVKYADLHGCTAWISNFILSHDETSR